MNQSKKLAAAISNDEANAQLFRENPQLAAEFLNAIIKDGRQDELLIAMRQLAQAFGGVASVARVANLNPKTLYRTLSAEGNPELQTLIAILKVMGLGLTIAPLTRQRPRRRLQAA